MDKPYESGPLPGGRTPITSHDRARDAADAAFARALLPGADGRRAWGRALLAAAAAFPFGLAAYFLLAGNGGAQPAPYADVITDEGTAQGLSGTEVTVSGIAHEGGTVCADVTTAGAAESAGTAVVGLVLPGGALDLDATWRASGPGQAEVDLATEWSDTVCFEVGDIESPEWAIRLETTGTSPVSVAWKER